ncbi:MAG: hypothetical protein LC748_01220, partial [Thermomicrobia bacterium]|nr:hypothetical protein [Thermomicrobia bacterium]
MDAHERSGTPRFGDESPLFRWSDSGSRDLAAEVGQTGATGSVEMVTVPMTPAMRAALQHDTWYRRFLTGTKNLVGPVFGPYLYLPLGAGMLVGAIVLVLVVGASDPSSVLIVLPLPLIVIALYYFMIRSIVRPSHWSRHGRAEELANGVVTRLGGPVTVESRTKANGTAVSVVKLGDHEILETQDDALLAVLNDLDYGYADYAPRTAFLFAIRDTHGDVCYSGPHYTPERVPHIAPDAPAPAAMPPSPPAST